MKQILPIIALTIFAGSQAFATDGLFSSTQAHEKTCQHTKYKDLSEDIQCYEDLHDYLKKLNDQRLNILSKDVDLAENDLGDLIGSVTSLRAATQARKRIFCSLKSAASPVGGRTQAISNRQCYLSYEQKLEKELIAIRKLADKTIERLKSLSATDE